MSSPHPSRTVSPDGVLVRLRSGGRTRASVLAATMTLSGFGVFAATPASANDGFTSTVAVTPATATSGTTTEQTVRVTNTSTAADKVLGSAQVLLPAGFTLGSVVDGSLSVVGIADSSATTNQRRWTAVVETKQHQDAQWPCPTGAGTECTKLAVTAPHAKGSLGSTGYVQVKVKVTAPGGSSSTTWRTHGWEKVSYNSGGTFTFGSQPTVAVSKATQTITFEQPLPNKTFRDAAFVVGATGGASGMPVTFTGSGACATSGDSGTMVALTGAGTCTLKANQGGNNFYESAPEVTRTFAVARASQTITFDALTDKVFGEAAFPVSATGGASGEPVTYSVAPNADNSESKCSVSESTVTINGAGRCAITAAQAGNANYNAATSVTRDFQIQKAGAALTLVEASQTHDYDGTAAAVTVNTTPAGLAEVNITYSQNDKPVASPIDAGTYRVVATLDHSNYTGSVSGELVIHPKPITGSFTVAGKTYDGTTAATINGHDLNSVVSRDSGLVTLTGGTATFNDKDAGTKTATGSTFSLAGNRAGNYTLGTVSNTAGAQISQLDITAQITAGDKTYDGTTNATDVAGVVPMPGKVGGDNLSLAVVSAAFDSATAGARTVTASVALAGADAGNYRLTSNTASVSANISKAAGSVVLTAPTAPIFGGNATLAFIKAGDGEASAVSSTTGTCTVEGTSVSFVAAGDCTLTPSVAAGTNHDVAGGTDVTFNIARAAGSVSISNIPMDVVRGGSFTPQYAMAGNGIASTSSSTTGVCTVADGVVSFVNSGICTLVAAVTQGTNHLAANGEPVSVIVAKSAGSVSIDNLPASAVVGGTFTPTYTKDGNGTASTSSTNTDVCTVASGVVNYVAAGTCTLQASVTAGTNHEAATGDAQNFTITAPVATAPVITAPVWTKSGYFAPVDVNTSTKKFLNTVKGGSTVPLKFHVFKDGVEHKVTDGLSFAVKSIPCDSAATPDQVVDLTTGSTTLRYDGTQFIQHWKTPTTLGCYQANVTLPDGQLVSADFRILK